jgi:hypothetical protein
MNRRLAFGAVIALAVGVAFAVFGSGGDEDEPLRDRPTPATTVEVPAAIADDCSKAVDAELNRWLAAVPHGSTVLLGAGKCYGQDGTVEIRDRRGLTIDGRGATLKALTRGDLRRSNLRILGGRDITVRNLIVRGVREERRYEPGWEFQHGYDFRGTVGGRLENVQAYNVVGDFVYAGHDSRKDTRTAPPARDITVTGGRFQTNGRMGVAMVNVDGFLLEKSKISDVALTAVDAEPDVPEQTVRNIRVVGNEFGFVTHSVFASVGKGGGDRHGRMVIEQNTMTEAPPTCVPVIFVDVPVRDARRSEYTIRDNRFLARSAAVKLSGVDRVVITGNQVDHTTRGCPPHAAVQLDRSQDVTIDNNRFSGAASVLRAEGSEGVREQGNSTSGR